jgi:hypothetical protein
MKANAIQNAIRREMDALKEPVTGFHEKVLMYWHQAKNDPQSTTGDKAIIECISTSPAKAVNSQTKARRRKLLSSSENPFRLAYVVDVAVVNHQGAACPLSGSNGSRRIR